LPVLTILYALITNLADTYSLRLSNPQFWNNLPSVLVALAAVFVGDFVGYWRHRFEHTRLLWPAHAARRGKRTEPPANKSVWASSAKQKLSR
jgi:hypothetical protein